MKNKVKKKHIINNNVKSKKLMLDNKINVCYSLGIRN